LFLFFIYVSTFSNIRLIINNPIVKIIGVEKEFVHAIKIPIELITHIKAAVVTPTILSSFFIITPAPKNPIPVII
jgi:hypothetical protein